MKRSSYLRMTFNLALVISLLFLPWWAGAVVLISACFLIDHFFEAVIYGILADSLYANRFGIYGFSYAATLYAAIILSISATVRKRLSW